ncbi:hypothetical protein DRP07_12375 [Archaeoglobales archaeon]|nr:MAG: hypothetical protein DRP07_12375 [Archaeoglobales archaeon]
MKGKLVIILVISLISACFIGCVEQKTQETPKTEVKEKTLKIGTTMTIKTDNIFSDYYFSILAKDLTHRGLIAMDSNGGFIPDLAYKWETKDGKTWTFYLVKNATWHDGKPVTAEDIKFTIEYLTEKVPIYKRHWSMIEKVSCPDEHTVVIELEEPTATLLVDLLVMRTLPKHIWEKVEDPLKYDGDDKNIGCGQFMFERFDPAAGTIVYRANPDYFGKKANLDKIVVKIYKNTDTMVMALRKGEVDTIYFYARGLDFIYVPQLLQEGNIKFIFAPNLGVGCVLWFNNHVYPYNITEFRHAIGYAINYEKIVEMITAGYGKVPNAGFVPEGWKYFKETKKMEYDQSKAGEILDGLKFIDVDGDGIRETPDGKDLEIEIIVRSDIAQNLRLAELIKGDLENVGLKVKLKPVDLNTFRAIVREKSHEVLISRTTAWGMMMWGGYGSGYIDARNIGWANVTDPEFYKIVDKLLISTDENEVKKFAYKIQDYYAEKLPVIPLYWDVHIQPYNEKIQGFVFNPIYGILNDESLHNVKIAS